MTKGAPYKPPGKPPEKRRSYKTPGNTNNNVNNNVLEGETRPGDQIPTPYAPLLQLLILHLPPLLLQV